MSEINKNIGNITSKIAEQGAPVIERLLDKLTGKGALIKYSFNDLKIEMPSVKDPNGRNIREGKITIRGTIAVSARVQHLEDQNNDMKGTGISISNENSESASESKDNNLVDYTTGHNLETSAEEPALRDYNSTENPTS
ncbi:hypothetical protein [Candidatus Nitrosocosmicus franklandus]|uniref:Uncharacterized protein n=1 Tax=Candidatus Nitrosocosmicus franklandianus TaxID=1798806 RepID=A0A484IEP6_9ARCH|nr:hypothetical protein [Candidatus Nitrosocosmicus franklandus]VFJ15287.1 conserved protein of unknown function [Candidatus Nitrosocosmicus franklandus]